MKPPSLQLGSAVPAKAAGGADEMGIARRALGVFEISGDHRNPAGSRNPENNRYKRPIPAPKRRANEQEKSDKKRSSIQGDTPPAPRVLSDNPFPLRRIGLHLLQPHPATGAMAEKIA
ncbi:MAG: hypothetical protein AB1405_15950 [Bdellovibrionota bacterium]